MSSFKASRVLTVLSLALYSACGGSSDDGGGFTPQDLSHGPDLPNLEPPGDGDGDISIDDGGGDGDGDNGAATGGTTAGSGGSLSEGGLGGESSSSQSN